ncbi:beta-phosphoglucomutase [Halalkalibacter urbisdiaboli]|uniref:beta-phosphoglucomutase n=1 Tax=Halalkalibacter urbisdiaboli TaxID=1960589 RepID=UPI001FDA35D3|nr:beta-phosphoglucomutase [Halalkalibacter urbisdiaboli]
MKAVIFDMDGVISNTVPIQYEINRRIASKLGFMLNRQENQDLQGLSRRDTLEKLVEKSGKQLSHDEIDRLSDERNKEYLTVISTLTKADILPGMESFIEELYKRKIPMAVASASRNAPKVLHQLGLLERFDHVVDVSKLRRGKPDPEIFLTAAKALGVNDSQCVAIEDGEAGLTAILQTNMFSVGIGAHEAMKQADLYLKETAELTFETLTAALLSHQLTIKI